MSNVMEFIIKIYLGLLGLVSCIMFYAAILVAIDQSKNNNNEKTD